MPTMSANGNPTDAAMEVDNSEVQEWKNATGVEKSPEKQKSDGEVRNGNGDERLAK